MHTEPIINKPLWDIARWNKTAFIVTEDLDAQPGIALYFDDIDAGRKIFADWQARFGGAGDRLEELRVVIIRGTHPDGRDGFTLGLGTEILPAPGQPLPTKPTEREVYYRWRFQAADEPQQSLDWLQASYKQHRMLFLVLPLHRFKNLA